MEEHPQGSDRAVDLQSAIADARAVAREQVLAAWQIHIDRLREQLEAGWQETVDQIFEERFAEVESRLRSGYEEAIQKGVSRHVDEASSFARTAARRDLTEQLNRTIRSLKGAETRDVWIHTLLDAAQEFCGRSAFFLLTAKGLKFAGVRGGTVAEGGAAAGEIPLSSAPAFAGAVDSKDTVVASGTPRELSQAVCTIIGDPGGRRVYLFPVLVRSNAVAVLYAEAGEAEVDVSALELLVGLAGSSIEAGETVSARSETGNLVRIAGGEPAKSAAKPAWADLSKTDQEMHLRAQRFARTQVAQMLLHKVNQVRAGRASNNLYETLRGEIDAGRQSFREQFIANCSSMVDYYHVELVRSLTRDNAEALGSEYPGPLVV